MRRRLWLGLLAPLLSALPLPAPAQAGEAATVLVGHLEAGTLAAGEAELERLAAKAPDDPEVRFALGADQFLGAVEKLGRAFYRHGLDAPDGFGAPLFRMPLPENPSPQPLSYPALRAILADFVTDMSVAEATLAQLGDGEVKIVVDLAQVRMDLDGDGRAGDDERLVRLLAAADPTGLDATADGTHRLLFAFDRADAIWLRGYSQVLMSFADFLLAHDFSTAFDGAFHVMFPRAGLPMQDKSTFAASTFTPNDARLADALAFVHLIRWPVVEPDRMTQLRGRLLSVIALSRADWRAILAETDDDREWVPSPRQTSPFPGLVVTDAQVQAWLSVLDAGQALLEGRLLAPHWRFEKGIDVKRVFEDPRPFDLVLWITGQAALPYLSDGPVLTSDADVLDAFQGQLLRYVVWFN